MTLVFMSEFAMWELESQESKPFEPKIAAAVLDTVADFVEQCSDQGSVRAQFFREAVGELRAAEGWLQKHVTPFDTSSRQILFDAAESGAPFTLEMLVGVLRSTAMEIAQIQKLLELRGPRRYCHGQ